MNLIETQKARIQALENRVKDLESTSTIPALENEIAWLTGIIYNPSYNAIDMRLLLQTTPREMRMRLTADVPEQTIYIPALAKKAHCGEKTASKRLRKFADEKMISYRTAVDQETGHTRAHFAPLPTLEQAPSIHIDRPKTGGSTWQDGQRVKRCKDCGSVHLAKVSQIVCMDCGAPQTEKSYKDINAPDSDMSDDRCHSDTDDFAPEIAENQQFEVQVDHSHSDTDDLVSDLIQVDHSHSDTDDCTSIEDLKLPSIRVDTVVVSTEIVEPPQFLRDQKIWCCHRAKVPYEPWGRVPQKAKPNDATTWGTYDQALRLYEDSVKYGYKDPYDGIGFMCTGEFTVVDHDHCIEDGVVSENTNNNVIRIDSYAEVSYSGTGIHQIAIRNIPRNIKRSDIGVEMYDNRRFMTWTGKHIIGTPATIEQRQEKLTALFEEIAPEIATAFDNIVADNKKEGVATVATGVAFTDDEVLHKATSAANGAKFTALFNGDWTAYPSQSEADLALCIMLAYWSDGNVHTIDSLFRKSALMREKWDRDDYRDWTIGRALQLVKDRAA